jgi:hypothetical protein
MATAVLNLSDLNNELPILPSVIMLVNNQETQLVRSVFFIIVKVCFVSFRLKVGKLNI